MIQGKQIADASIEPIKLVVPYGATFVYRPGGVPSGNVYADPWALADAAFATGGVPVDVYVDCSLQSPAPWPVDIFLPNIAYHAAPVLAPAILGLVNGTSPSTGFPSNGTLWFPRELDGVGIVNTSSTAGQMVTVGQIFGQTFTMKNGAFIQRANDADLLGLFIVGNPTFSMEIDNSTFPFQNLADPSSTSNVQFFGAGGMPGRTLDLLIKNGGPNFLLTSFTSNAGSILNIRYDASIPPAEVTMLAWSGPVSRTPLAQAASTTYTPGAPGNWVAPPPATSEEAFDRIAADLFAHFGAIP